MPFASYVILIHVFANHDKMNRGLLEWRVPVTLDQERTFDLRRISSVFSFKLYSKFNKRLFTTN